MSLRLLYAETLLGCAAPTVHVENTSGECRIASVRTDQDVFMTDTLAPGASLCWALSDRAGSGKVWLVIDSPADTGFNPLRGLDQSWIDSLPTDKSTSVAIHASEWVAGTAEWESWRQRSAAAGEALARAFTNASVRMGVRMGGAPPSPGFSTRCAKAATTRRARWTCSGVRLTAS